MAKGNKKSSSKKKSGGATEAPVTITAKGGLAQGKLLDEVLFTMEDELRISKKAGKDFMDSLVVTIERELAEGRPVNIGGLVKLSPRLHTKGERMVNSEFGNPESPKVKKKYPAKVSLKATVMKKAKDALPTVQKLQKIVG
jgi:nucleoid DNA-binding protein